MNTIKNTLHNKINESYKLLEIRPNLEVFVLNYFVLYSVVLLFDINGETCLQYTINYDVITIYKDFVSIL